MKVKLSEQNVILRLTDTMNYEFTRHLLHGDDVHFDGLGCMPHPLLLFDDDNLIYGNYIGDMMIKTTVIMLLLNVVLTSITNI